MLADLMDLYWYGKRDLAGEIRLQGQCFGLTPIDRRRLQWEVQRVEAERKKPERDSAVEPVAVSKELMRALA